MITEITKTNDEPTSQAWVGYDGECPLCVELARCFGPTLRRHRFDLAPLQTPWLRERLGLRADEPLTEMRLLNADGRIWGGADAVVQIARRIWWAWPLFVFAQLPGTRNILRLLYRWIAQRRNCWSGACERAPLKLR